MKIAPRSLGLHPALLSAAAMLVMAGCTLSGSSGLGDVTPVPGGEEDGQPEVPVVQPTTVPTVAVTPSATSALAGLEGLGTQAALTATVEAAGGAAGTTPQAGVTPGAAATLPFGGEILPPTNTPVGTLVPAAQAGTCPPTHTVAQGENMYRIALRYGTTYAALAAANGIANPNQISTGLVLNIPGCGGAATTGGAAPATVPGTATGTTHTVQAGENLFRIALQYNLTWTALAAANGITNPDLLVVGQVLQIPR